MPSNRSISSQPPPAWESVATSLSSALLHDLRIWFAEHQRPLPWRRVPPPLQRPSAGLPSPSLPLRDPYGTWVSEVMSQQTRIQTVVQYWEKWMMRFPTVADLAAASPDDVRAAWTGLGYYRRADLLHRGAKYVMETCQGTIPHTREELMRIPGIGAYSAAAIASICYGQDCVGVDGNVMRVLARLGGVRNFDPKRPADALQARKWAAVLAESCREVATATAVHRCETSPTHVTGDKVPQGTSGQPVITSAATSSVGEALIELGATVCRPVGSPECSRCPLRHVCRAHSMLSLGDIESIEGVIPLRGSKVAKIGQESVTGVLHVHVHPTTGEISMILGKRKEGGLLSNMFEVPNRPSGGRGGTAVDCAARPSSRSSVARTGKQADGVAKALSGGASKLIDLGLITHKFSHLHLTMHAYAVRHSSLASLSAMLASSCLRSLLHNEGGNNTELAVVNERNRSDFAISKLVDKVVALVRRSAASHDKDATGFEEDEEESCATKRRGEKKAVRVKSAPAKRTRSGSAKR